MHGVQLLGRDDHGVLVVLARVVLRVRHVSVEGPKSSNGEGTCRTLFEQLPLYLKGVPWLRPTKARYGRSTHAIDSMR